MGIKKNKLCIKINIFFKKKFKKYYKYFKHYNLLNYKYDVKKFINKGSFGEVYLAIDKSCINYSDVVIKEIIPGDRTKTEIKNEINQEIECFKKIGKSEYIVQYKECIFSCFSYPKMVYEYVGIDLDHYIDKYDYELNKVIITQIIYDILCGLKVLHKNNYIHADIKCSNICLWYDYSIRAKLIDLGGVETLSETGYNEPKCWICTRYTRAPELLLKDNWNTKIDLWSVGCILYRMLTGNFLFNEDSAKKQLKQINNFYTNINSENDLINYFKKDILKYRKYKYYNINNLVILLAKLLNYDSNKRISAEEAIHLMIDW